MTEPLRIAIAGLGTVGVGVVKILAQNKDIIAQRAGREIQIVAVSARNKDADRGISVSEYQWVDDTANIATMDGIDGVVELIGGSEGIAADVVRSSLGNKLHVVTANKALLAHHGFELATIAENNNVSLMYEAAVAGCIPIIKSMREGLAANQFSAVYGILNGTCNYILTKMQKTGEDFSDVLQEAQELGYAEADPVFDVEGIDAAHKLCLLTSIAFGVKPDFDALKITGISDISSIDIEYAQKFGYRIKLLGIARRIGDGIIQFLEPCLVPAASPMGMIDDVYNAVYTEGEFVKTPLFTGRGAGEGPTASAVVADLIDLARGVHVPTFGTPVGDLQDANWIDLGETTSRYYLRMMVIDQPGVFASVAAILRDLNISIEGAMQSGRDPDQLVPIVLTLHEARHADVQKAVRAIEQLDVCSEKPCVMRIEEL